MASLGVFVDRWSNEIGCSDLFSQFIKPFGIRLTSDECADLIWDKLFSSCTCKLDSLVSPDNVSNAQCSCPRQERMVFTAFLCIFCCLVFSHQFLFGSPDPHTHVLFVDWLFSVSVIKWNVCRMQPYFIPFYGWIIFHWSDLTHYLLFGWWTVIKSWEFLCRQSYHVLSRYT